MSTTTTQPALAVADLTVQFRTRGPGRAVVHAVRGVDFEIGAGETLGLIGESGSGKSTVARAISQLLRHPGVTVTGSVSLDGHRLDTMSGRELRTHRHRMQMVFQDPSDALDPRMTVRQSVAEPLKILKKLKGTRLAEATAAALDAVGLDPAHADRRRHELSGGQRQRVNIARAIGLEPQLVLCDEVVSALDVSIQADILNLLSRLQAERGIAYLFISHDLGVVASISDRIGVMYLGRIVELGTVDQIVTAPRHPYTEALLSAEPEALPSRLRRRNRIILDGDLPSPISPPSGCGFRTRCRYATEACAAEVPLLRDIAGDHHLVACHYAADLHLAGRPIVAAAGTRPAGTTVHEGEATPT